MQHLDDTDPFLLHIKIVDNDTDEEIECEERAKDDEEDEVEVHKVASVSLWLMTDLRNSLIIKCGNCDALQLEAAGRCAGHSALQLRRSYRGAEVGQPISS